MSTKNIKSNKNIYSLFENKSNLTSLNYMMAVDYKAFMNDDVLTKVDRATMSVSLEGREPLLDHRLIEYLARVPENIKYKNKQGKYLLRQILYKYLPQEMVVKPKSGFQIPLEEWLKGDLRYLVERYLDEKRLDDEIFNIFPFFLLIIFFETKLEILIAVIKLTLIKLSIFLFF